MNRFAAFALALVCIAARADVTLPAIFGDHMVLQRGMKIPIWGMADPGENITVTIVAGTPQQKSTTADENGKWRVVLGPMDARDAGIAIVGKNSITLSDVLIGEVWVCSGQSNMEWKLIQSSTSQPALAAADRPKVRLFMAQHGYNDQPQDDL